MLPKTGQDGTRVLEFDGGGINVLSALVIVWELMCRIQAIHHLSALPVPCDIFDLICGTGTGGLVAILLGRLRLSITTAVECYVEILNRGFIKKGMGVWFGTEDAFSASALEKVMGEVVARHCGRADARMIDDQRDKNRCEVMVCAMSADAIRGGIPTCIRTYKVAANQGLDCTIVEAARATTAMPGMFKPATIVEQNVKCRYVGGGLGCNNPTTHMLSEVERLFPGRPVASVLSVGSGQLHSANIPERSRLSSFLPSKLVQTLGSIAMDCEKTNQELSVRFGHTPHVYFRFNAEQGMQDIDQSDLARLPEVQAHTKNYLSHALVTATMDNAVRSISVGVGAVAILEGNIQPLKQPRTRIGRCPPPSRVFTGREDILDQMDSYFSKSSSLERHLFVLHGLGGAGKTQLALKFVKSHLDTFWDVFYIDATTRQTISAELAALAKAANAGETPEQALEWLASQEERWLLVINNADDPDLNLNEFFPTCEHGDILITTRNQQMAAHTTGPDSFCRVGGMQPDDALELLLKTSGSDDQDETVEIAKTLAEDLGYLALAIVQSGAYMRATQCGIAEYARIFRTARTRLLRERPTKQLDDYQLSLHASWDISYRQLPPRVAQLLHLMSFFHHEGISEVVFEAASVRSVTRGVRIPLTSTQETIKAAVFKLLGLFRTPSGDWDPLALKDLTNQLRAYSLLDYDTGSCSYSMHPLVQEWSRATALDTKSTRDSAAWVLALCVENRYSSEDYAFRRRLLPHLVALDSDHTQVVPELADYLWLVYDEAGYAKKAEALLAIAVQASRDALGNEHPAALTCMNNLAWAFTNQVRLEEAESLLIEVIEVRKRVLGHEHPDTLSSMHNLAWTYHDQGQWAKAEVLFLEVVETRKRVVGAEHRDTLTSMQQLASTYWSQGRLGEAEALSVEVLEAKQRVLGRDHPSTLVAMHNLASTYDKQGKLGEAESLMQETVALEKKVRGESHVEAQNSIRWLDRIQHRIQERHRLISAT